MKTMKGKNVLVTGGAGFIGSHLCKKLVQMNSHVTVYDDLSSGSLENLEDIEDQLVFQKGDISDFTKLDDSIGDVDLIFHLAAQVSVPYSMENPLEDFKANVVGTLNVVEKARKTDAKLVFTSSAAVYGNPPQIPTPESCEPNPVSFYGLSKLMGEEYCNFYHERYGLETSVMRIANAYGLGGHGVIPDFLKKLNNNPQKLEIIGTGMQSRDFIHVSHVVETLLLAAVKNSAIGETFNVGLGSSIRIIDLAKIILDMLDLNSTKIITTNEPWKGDVTTICLDIEKTKKKLDWTPQKDLKEGLKELLENKV